MTIVRVLHAESLKMKRTIALKMVVAAPATVVLLILFLVSQAPFSAPTSMLSPTVRRIQPPSCKLSRVLPLGRVDGSMYIDGLTGGQLPSKKLC
jgi:hypothetical protein